jgi:hypothetical protein
VPDQLLACLNGESLLMGLSLCDRSTSLCSRRLTTWCACVVQVSRKPLVCRADGFIGSTTNLVGFPQLQQHLTRMPRWHHSRWQAGMTAKRINTSQIARTGCDDG